MLRLYFEPLGFLEKEPQVTSPHAHVEEAENLKCHQNNVVTHNHKHVPGTTM